MLGVESSWRHESGKKGREAKAEWGVTGYQNAAFENKLERKNREKKVSRLLGRSSMLARRNTAYRHARMILTMFSSIWVETHLKVNFSKKFCEVRAAKFGTHKMFSRACPTTLYAQIPSHSR